MKLSIIPLSQKDERWGRKRLGTGTGTISNYGCLLTCHAMMLTYYGHEFLPDVLNEVYKTKEVFDQGNMVNFFAAANVFGDITADEFYNCFNDPCDLTKIDKYLEQKKPVIAMVDFSPTAGVQTHFVLIIGKTEDGSYLINDPWTGETYFFHAKYGDPATYIFGLRLYSGVPKDEISEADKISDLNDALKSCNLDLSKKAEEVSQLRVDLETQERDNSDLAKQLLEARTARDKVDWGKTVLEKQIESRNEQIQTLKNGMEVLKQKNTQLKSALKASESLEISKFSTRRLFVAWLRKLFLRSGDV